MDMMDLQDPIYWEFTDDSLGYYPTKEEIRKAILCDLIMLFEYYGMQAVPLYFLGRFVKDQRTREIACEVLSHGDILGDFVVVTPLMFNNVAITLRNAAKTLDRAVKYAGMT